MDELISTNKVKRGWHYNRKNTLKNILDFEFILNYTKPLLKEIGKDEWRVRAYAMSLAGGSTRGG